MANTQRQKRMRPKVNLRSIALPAEHGGWSLILEPLILGLLLTPTIRGLSLALAMFLLFLAHQPTKIMLKDYRNDKLTQRTRMASYFALGYLLFAGLFAIPSFIQSDNSFWLTIALILPFVLVQMLYDFRNQSRNLIAELTGAIALSGTVSLILILGTWQFEMALLLWMLIGLRAVTSILYVRTFFRKQRKQRTSITANYLIHIFALVIVAMFALQGMLPYLSLIPFLILLARAIHGLQSEQIVKAQVIGIREVIFGIFTIAFITAGFALNL